MSQISISRNVIRIKKLLIDSNLSISSSYLKFSNFYHHKYYCYGLLSSIRPNFHTDNHEISHRQFENQQKKHNNPIRLKWDIITAILALLGIENIDSDDKKESPLIMMIKRGILAKQRKQFHQAEMLLHTALKMAQDLSYTDAETYIFDIMADNYFEKGDYERSIELYLEVLSRLSKKEDFTTESESLIEISIKLSYCYGQLKQIENAEKGFQYSIDTQLLRIASFYDDKNCKLLIEYPLNEEQKNSLALLGMAYDYYSKHLQQLSIELLERSLIYREKALKISIIINGDKHPQTLILENDMADLFVQLKKYDHAKSYLQKAIDKAIDLNYEYLLPIFYLNLAAIHDQNNRQDLAKKYCHEAMTIMNQLKSRNDFDEQILTDKEQIKLMEKCELCLNGLQFY